jgi:prepilin-type N-terminal cleavage/methylation domain-containing protein
MSGQCSRKDDQGFTLIETLVSLVITGVIAAIAAPSFMTWLNNKKVDDVLAQVEGSLKEAQSTAIRKNTTCNVLIKADRITAVETDQSSPEVPSCLPTGWRQIQQSTGVSGTSQNGGANKNIAVSGTGGSSGTIVKFSTKGTTLLTPTTQAVVISRTDDDSNNSVKKCIVVSSGIGIIRTGKYIDTSLPTFADPTSPTETEVDAVITKCISS